LEEIIFENFNISENNIISVELAKVLGLYGVLWTCKENTSFFWHLSHCIRFMHSFFFFSLSLSLLGGQIFTTHTKDFCEKNVPKSPDFKGVKKN
jgi:hypothetical protein